MSEAAARAAPKVLIVSASDTRFMPFLRGMVESLGPVLERPGVELACFDLGLSEGDRDWLVARGARLETPRRHLGVGEQPVALLSFLARPFLAEYFPGFDVYLWIDSDVWLQRPETVDLYVDGALARGMAITHERERAYRLQPWLLGWTAKHFVLGYGATTAAWLLACRHVNAGMFAVRAGAPHLEAWARRYEAAIGRTGKIVPHDQFALNHALRGGLLDRPGLETAFLDPGCNWICDRGVPMWNDEAGAFCKPYAPYEPIGALHLAGPAKFKPYEIKRTGGGAFRSCILRGASPESPVAESPLGRAGAPLASAA